MLPACPLVGLTESEAEGVALEILTVTLFVSDPLPFIQVSVKVLFEVILVMVSVCEPAVMSFGPNQSPDAMQEVGEFVETQVSIDESPLVTWVGDAESVTNGAVTGAGAHMAGSLPVTP